MHGEDDGANRQKKREDVEYDRAPRIGCDVVREVAKFEDQCPNKMIEAGNRAGCGSAALRHMLLGRKVATDGRCLSEQILQTLGLLKDTQGFLEASARLGESSDVLERANRLADLTLDLDEPASFLEGADGLLVASMDLDEPSGLLEGSKGSLQAALGICDTGGGLLKGTKRLLNSTVCLRKSPSFLEDTDRVLDASLDFGESACLLESTERLLIAALDPRTRPLPEMLEALPLGACEVCPDRRSYLRSSQTG